jgi:hypothetical protein
VKRIFFTATIIILLYGNILSLLFASPKLFGYNAFLTFLIICLTMVTYKLLLNKIWIIIFILFSLISILKCLYENSPLTSGYFKLVFSLFLYIQFFLYLKQINFKDPFYINFLFLILGITSLIVVIHKLYLPNLTIELNEFGESVGFKFLTTDTGYTRDGLFGANIFSYILAINFILLFDKNIRKNITKWISYFFVCTSWISILIMQSRYAVIVFFIFTFYYLFVRFSYIAFIFLFSLIFLAPELEISKRFYEPAGRSEKISLYINSIITHPEVFLFGQSKDIVDDFNKSSDISLSDNSYLEVFLGGGIFFFILFFLVILYIISNSFFILKPTIIWILFFFIIGLFITTSIYFINYVFFFLLSLKYISTLSSKNSKFIKQFVITNN